MKTFCSLSAAVALLLAVTPTPSQAQITWGASNSNGLGDASGTVLPIGDLVEIGTFNLSNEEIQQHQFALPTLLAAFLPFDTAFIGDDLGVAGYWNKQSTGSTDALNLDHRQIYYWAFNAATPAQATQQGIFTANNNPRWLFPADSDIPHTTTVDLSDVNEMVVGGFGNGFSSATGTPFPLFNLAAVPEPAFSGLAIAIPCFLCAAALRIAKRRQQRV